MHFLCVCRAVFSGVFASCTSLEYCTCALSLKSECMDVGEGERTIKTISALFWGQHGFPGGEGGEGIMMESCHAQYRANLNASIRYSEKGKSSKCSYGIPDQRDGVYNTNDLACGVCRLVYALT
jgi:hypothetical protein